MKLRTCALCDLTAGEPLVMPGTRRGKAIDRCTNFAACGRRRRKAEYLVRQARRERTRTQESHVGK